MRSLSEPWERVGLAAGRIVIGILWLTQLQWKMPPSFGCPADFAVSADLNHRTTGLCDWTGLMAVYSTQPLHRAFVENVIVPNIRWMGWGIWLLEAFFFVSLTFGLFTRFGSLLGILQSVNLYIGLTGLPFEWYWTYGMLVVLHWIFFFTTPGRTMGVDQFLIPAVKSRAATGNRFARGFLLLM